ncbi:RING finger and CHY zinc finger domain-containing protein 1 [Etheostoma cragini]|uniref:RING finger and CHY zinc finger domain-containing protein 1 n=1 Tax=Etheostoma cragini TaxID=417921 RepID=UPI00155F3991|nr:RING finger and CHY zinc finger domain-containing protein 1 [Etheostoma cragini]
MASPAGCEHYVRSCLLKAPCCGKLYVCRLCHDAEENHPMDRFQVREVQCSECQTVQQAQQTCQQCHVQFGEYYCDICHLFDKDKKQYHCQPCGICRAGFKSGVVQVIHLISDLLHVYVTTVLTHLQQSELFHFLWFRAYRCPLCMHSAWNMEDHWDQIDKEIAQSPMPTEYQGATVKIICNDCQAHCTVPFHVLGMKCSGCGSYNTAQDGGLIQQPEQQQPEQQQPEQDAGNEAETEPDAEPEQLDQPLSPTLP